MSCKDSEGAGFVCAYGWVTLWLAFHTNLQRKKHCGWAGGDLLQTHPAAVCCYTAVTHLGNKSNVEKMEKKWRKKNKTKKPSQIKDKKPKEVMYWQKKAKTEWTDGLLLSERHRTWKYLPKLLPLRQVPKPFWLELSFPRLGSWLMHSKLSCKLK